MSYQLCVPCVFGVEGITASELKRLSMENVLTENGRVLFSGTKEDIARANINLRTGERVLLVAGTCGAKTFDMLFEGVKAMPWEEYIPMDGNFPVKGYSLNSALHSIPDCQKIIKKAIVERLKLRHKISWFAESGPKYQVRFAIMNDVASLYIDTSGTGLHKRGYRPVGNAAPLKETLAAAMVNIARYRGREAFCDPFCGSGTIPIEAALAALNRAPGLGRGFISQTWSWMDKKIWENAKDEARDKEFKGTYDIWGGDIDPECIEISKANAKRAGVDKHIRCEVSDACSFHRSAPGGMVVSNPPYGERVMEHREAERLYKEFGKAVRELEDWKLYLLSSHPEFERTFGKTANKKRKLYNGMLKCDLFMYY